jgi:hypothetical protein
MQSLTDACHFLHVDPNHIIYPFDPIYQMISRSGRYIDREAENHVRPRDLVDAVMELMESSLWVVSVIADWGRTELAFKRIDRIYTANPSYALTLLGAFIGKGVFAKNQPGFQYAAEKIVFHLQAKAKAGNGSGGTAADVGAWKTALHVALDREELLEIASIRTRSIAAYYQASTGDELKLLLVRKLSTLKSFEAEGKDAVDTVLLHMLRNGSVQLKVQALMVGVGLLPTEQAVEVVRELEAEMDENFKIAWLDDMVRILPAKEVLENIVKLLRDAGSEHLKLAAVSMCKPGLLSWADPDFYDHGNLWASVQRELLAMLKVPSGAHSTDALRSVTLRKKAFSILVAQFNHDRIDYGGVFTEEMLKQEIHTTLAGADSDSGSSGGGDGGGSDLAMKLAVLDELKGSLARHKWCRLDSIQRLIVALIETPGHSVIALRTHVMSEEPTFLARAADVDLEDGKPRSVLSGVFRGLTLQGFEESLEGLDHPNYTILIKKALKKAKRVKKYAHMSLCKKAALVFFTMEDYPRAQAITPSDWGM